MQEKVSGAARGNRPALHALLASLEAGDVPTITRLDRLARSTKDLLAIIDELAAAGVGLRSLAEPWADTTTPAGKMVMTVFAGIAEFERALIGERAEGGRVAARDRGVRFGRPAALTPFQRKRALKMLEDDTPTAEIAEVFRAHPSTIS